MNARRLAPLLVLGALGCRGQISAEPPIHVVPDMDWQPKVRPEAATPFFPDGRGMRPLVEGTVARGELKEDDAFYRGRVGANAYVAVAPVEPSVALLKRGQERFNIYCSPCHDRSGSGHGIVVQRGFPVPVDLTSDRVRLMPDGQVFETMTQGVRNMPSYRVQVPEQDRWAIVAYLRALQRSQHATLEDVPPELRNRIEPEGGGR